MAKVGLEALQGKFLDVDALNRNFAKIESFLDEVLQRANAVSPNQMNNLLDMNSNNIINLPAPASSTEPVRAKDIGYVPDEDGTPIIVANSETQTLSSLGQTVVNFNEVSTVQTAYYVRTPGDITTGIADRGRLDYPADFSVTGTHQITLTEPAYPAGTTVTAVQGFVDDGEGAPPGVVTSVFGRGGDVIAQSGDYNTTLVNNSSGVTGVTTTDALNNLNSVDSTLDARLTTAESNIVSNDSDITSLQGRMTTAETNISTNTTNIGTNTSAINTLDTRVTNNEGDVSGLDSRVTTNETDISTNTTNLSNHVSNQNNPHSTTFLKLPDTPGSYTANQFVAVNSSGNALEFVPPPNGGGGSETFAGLTDTPASYIGQGTKVVAVNAGETALEFITLSGSAPVDSVFGRIGAVVALDADYSANQVVYNPASSTLTDTRVQAAIDSLDSKVQTNSTNITSNASDISNNASTITQVQTDLTSHTGDTNNPHSTTAIKVPYTNTTSGLTAVDVQAAIDEIEARLDVIETTALKANSSNVRITGTNWVFEDEVVSVVDFTRNPSA